MRILYAYLFAKILKSFLPSESLHFISSVQDFLKSKKNARFNIIGFIYFWDNEKLS